jgi:hypothetical protein
VRVSNLAQNVFLFLVAARTWLSASTADSIGIKGPAMVGLRAVTGTLGLLSGAFLLSTGSTIASEYQVITVTPGNDADVYFQINLSGTVYLKIETPRGPGCADFWWIIWPLGTVKQLGTRCGSDRLPIPSWSDFAIASKLRVGGVSEPTKIIAASSETVANSITVRW